MIHVSVDVIVEILEEDFDALLNEGSKILHSIEGTILEEEIFSEFDKFIAMAANENYDSGYLLGLKDFKMILRVTTAQLLLLVTTVSIISTVSLKLLLLVEVKTDKDED
ncbi:hypothetical protein Tco_0090753 [Tanacetum coccineum]